MIAVVIGATGLIGRKLIELLIQDNSYEKVIVFARRALHVEHEKIVVHIFDFASLNDTLPYFKADVLFSCLGTTIKAAKTKEKQYEIDFHYQFAFAKAAEKNEVNKYVLISSAGADSKSNIFYSRMKGELDEKVKFLQIPSISILRPSVLWGERKENRLAEKFAIKTGNFLAKLGLFRKYRPIKDVVVAQAMINVVRNKEKYTVFTLNELFTLANER